MQNTALSWVMSGRAVPASDPLGAARPAEVEADEAKLSKQTKTALLAISHFTASHHPRIETFL